MQRRCRRCPNPLTPSPASFQDRATALHGLRPSGRRPLRSSPHAPCRVGHQRRSAGPPRAPHVGMQAGPRHAGHQPPPGWRPCTERSSRPQMRCCRAQAARCLMRGRGGPCRPRHAPLALACSRLWCVRAPQSRAGASSCAGFPDAPPAFKVLLWALSPVCVCVLDTRHHVEGLHWGTILSRQRHGDPTHGRHPGNLRVRVHENLGIFYAI